MNAPFRADSGAVSFRKVGDGNGFRRFEDADVDGGMRDLA